MPNYIYDELENLKKIKDYYKFGLQVSIFSDTPHVVESFVLRNIHVSRVTINKNPTYQNSLIPWGGIKVPDIVGLRIS